MREHWILVCSEEFEEVDNPVNNLYSFVLKIEESAATAAAWITQSLSRFWTDLRYLSDTEVLCTLGSELALFSWLISSRVQLSERITKVYEVRQILSRMKSRELVKEIAENQTIAAASGVIVHELALCSDVLLREQYIKKLMYSSSEEIVRSPSRKLELMYFMQQCGICTKRKAVLEVISSSPFLSSSPIDHEDRCQIYELTHLLFYITNFGRSPKAYLGKESQNILQQFLDDLLPLYIKKGDLDLVAELTLAQRCLSGQRYGSEVKGWQYLIQMQDNQGGFGIRPSTLTAFLDSYHPVLVTSLAGYLY